LNSDSDAIEAVGETVQRCVSLAGSGPTSIAPSFFIAGTDGGGICGMLEREFPGLGHSNINGQARAQEHDCQKEEKVNEHSS
jgi:hypothetical protein